MSIHNLLEQFYSWVLSYPPFTVLLIVAIILFIASVLESLPFAGMMFPSETLTVFFGIMAYKGIVDIKILIFVAFLGLFIGDEIGYKIGQRFGEGFIQRHASKLRIDEKRYETLKNSLDHHFFKILLVARSNGFTRWLVPFIAGNNNISYKKFTIANLITAAFWAPAFLLGGYFLGNIFEKYGQYLGLGIIIATIAAVILYKVYKYLDKQGYFKRDDFKLLIINLGGLFIFSKILEDVVDLEVIVKLDMWINTHISHIYTPFLTKVMIIVTSFDNTVAIAILTLLFTFYLFVKKYYKEILFLFISIVGATGLVLLFKNIVHRMRPDLGLVEIAGYSFPSVHVTIITALVFALFIILKNKMEHTNTLLIAAVTIPLFVAFSRIYLNIHYFSDVVAGIGLALFWVSFIAILFDLKKRSSETAIQ